VPPDALSFLIDECLHASLVEVANGMGHIAYHIEHLGLKCAPDWQLWKRASGRFDLRHQQRTGLSQTLS
jgi:predicted nuclease of predicted toxin-antitoxin system